MENQLLITLSRNKLLKNAEISKIDIRNIRGRLITIGEGEILYREGDIADIIYLVTSGEINILKKRLLGKTKSFIFSENDFFGHEEFFEETSRTSTAVALRDSYLIALTREEVEALIQQSDEILINLREPVAEIDEDSLLQNGIALMNDEKKNASASTEEIHWAPTFEDKPTLLEEEQKVDISEPQEYFKTISDISRADENISVQPLENFIQPPEPFTTTKKEDAFDESAFLNEDGIPKAEYELPDKPISPKFEEKKSDDDLNDALFNILSGKETTTFESQEKYDEPVSKENDDAFFKSFEFTEEPQQVTFTNEFTSKEEKPPIKHEPFIPSSHKEKIIPQVLPPPVNDFELEDIFNDVDKQIKELKQTAEPEKTKPQPHSKPARPMSNVNIADSMNADELQMIIKAAELVNSNIRVDEVLKNIIDVATDLTHADRGTLYLVDKEKNELWSLITLGDEMREIRLRIGEGLAGYVAKSGETINIKDVRHDPRFKSDFDKQSGYTTKNMICFPIKNNKREIVGVLQLINSMKGEFTKRDEEFLAALSIHSAIALNNAELVEKLLQGERVQSLGKMANFLIQDIKKPILVGKRYAEHLRSKSLPPETLQIVDMLLEQLIQVADLVQTTSSYSEGKTILRVLNVSLNNTLAEYASRVEQYVESRHCQIVGEYDKDVTLKLDVKEYFQTYMHIVKNACDAMPDGGKILISTKRVDKSGSIP
jgi:putative methionine-R-sulfoxide reductase with GAF domain